MTIGERIKHRRLEIGMSVEELAKLLGKNKATVYRYESNFIESMPTSILVPISKALKTTPAYLLGWDNSVSAFSSEYDEKSDLDQSLINLLSFLSRDQKEMLLAWLKTLTEKQED